MHLVYARQIFYILRDVSWFLVPPNVPAIIYPNRPSDWILCLFWIYLLSDPRPCRACEGGAGVVMGVAGCRWACIWWAPMRSAWFSRRCSSSAATRLVSKEGTTCATTLCVLWLMIILMNELVGLIEYITSIPNWCILWKASFWKHTTFRSGGSTFLVFPGCILIVDDYSG
jgi:hypothetical protein